MLEYCILKVLCKCVRDEEDNVVGRKVSDSDTEVLSMEVIMLLARNQFQEISCNTYILQPDPGRLESTCPTQNLPESKPGSMIPKQCKVTKVQFL